MRSTAFEGAARRREIPCCPRVSLERMRAERAVESMNATSPRSTTTVPTPSFSTARSIAYWNLGAVWRSISPRTETTEYPSACSAMLTSKSVPAPSSLESTQSGPWILAQFVCPVNRRFCTDMQCFLLIFGRDGRENHRAGGRLRRRGESLPLDQELLQRYPRLRQALIGGRRREEVTSGNLLHRREAGGRRGTGGELGALLRLQPQQVRLQGTLQAACGSRDPDPGRGEDGLAQGRLGHRRRRRHDAPRRARRHLRPRLRRRRLRRGRRVPPERKGHPCRGNKCGPMHLPGPPRRLRCAYRPRGYTGTVSAARAAESDQRSAYQHFSRSARSGLRPPVVSQSATKLKC